MKNKLLRKIAIASISLSLAGAILKPRPAQALVGMVVFCTPAPFLGFLIGASSVIPFGVAFGLGATSDGNPNDAFHKAKPYLTASILILLDQQSASYHYSELTTELAARAGIQDEAARLAYNQVPECFDAINETLMAEAKANPKLTRPQLLDRFRELSAGLDPAAVRVAEQVSVYATQQAQHGQNGN